MVRIRYDGLDPDDEPLDDYTAGELSEAQMIASAVDFRERQGIPTRTTTTTITITTTTTTTTTAITITITTTLLQTSNTQPTTNRQQKQIKNRQTRSKKQIAINNIIIKS